MDRTRQDLQFERDLQRWIDDARSTGPPPGFTERVMDRLQTSPSNGSDCLPAKKPEGTVSPSMRYQALTFWAKAAVIALASLIGISRYGLLLFFILFR